MENELKYFKLHVDYLKKLKELCDTKEYVLFSSYNNCIFYNEDPSIEHDNINSTNDIKYFYSDTINIHPGSNFIFTIDDIMIDASGCHQCKITYPSLSIYGYITEFYDNLVVIETKPYEGIMSTYNFFSCNCPRNKKFIPDNVFGGLYFNFYNNNNNYRNWHSVCVTFNIKYALKDANITIES